MESQKLPPRSVKKAWRKVDKYWSRGVATEETAAAAAPQQKQCVLCGGPTPIIDDGFPTCINPECGYVNNHVLDFSPEWNSFGANEKTGNDITRCGNPSNPLLKESSAACKVITSSKCSYEMRKIERWIKWQSMPHNENSLYNEFQYIINVSQIAGIPQKIIDDALHYHKDLSEQQMFRGANRDAIKAASIFLAFQSNECPRTSGEIAKIFMLDKRDASKGCAMAVDILNNIERNMSEEDRRKMCKITPFNLLDRFCGPFPQMTQTMVFLAKFIAQKVEREGLIHDNTPQAIASGIIYFINQVFKLGITKQHIIAECQISDVTINKCYKKLMEMREMLVPSELLAAKN